jgi:copper chaperone CopZ
MFHFFKKQPKGNVLTFKILDMHCTSCSINIDGALEDTPGVISANTSYAKGQTVVEFDNQKVDEDAILKVIASLNYTAQRLSK